MLPGWGSVPSSGSFRTPRLSNKSFLIWKSGFLNRFFFFLCFFLPSGSQTSGIHSHQQLFDSIFNLVFSFCIVFRGLKYMEEDWGLRRRFWTFCSPAGVSAPLLFLAPWSRWWTGRMEGWRVWKGWGSMCTGEQGSGRRPEEATCHRSVHWPLLLRLCPWCRCWRLLSHPPRPPFSPSLNRVGLAVLHSASWWGGTPRLRRGPPGGEEGLQRLAERRQDLLQIRSYDYFGRGTYCCTASEVCTNDQLEDW